MPKQSYAQEVADLEETLAAARASADILPPLALTVADELAAQIAEIRALKERQRAYAAEGKVVTQALNAEIADGMPHARYIRAYAVLVHGRKSGRLAQFGIRIRRRPRRKAGSLPEATANPLGTGANAPEAAHDEARTAHAARANDAQIGGAVREIGADAQAIGEKADPMRGNAPDVGAKVQPVGALHTGFGATASGDWENAPGFWGNVQNLGANLPETPTSQAT